MFGARLPFRLACLYNIFLVLVNAYYLLILFHSSINPINNYYIYRFNYFASLIARTLVFRPPFSRSRLSGCVLITAILVSPSCALVTAVVLCSQLCSCHRCRLVLSAVFLSPPSSCALGCALSLPLRSQSPLSPSTAQKPVCVLAGVCAKA